jgi:hypothetical protein
MSTKPPTPPHSDTAASRPPSSDHPDTRRPSCARTSGWSPQAWQGRRSATTPNVGDHLKGPRRHPLAAGVCVDRPRWLRTPHARRRACGGGRATADPGRPPRPSRTALSAFPLKVECSFARQWAGVHSTSPVVCGCARMRADSYTQWGRRAGSGTSVGGLGDVGGWARGLGGWRGRRELPVTHPRNAKRPPRPARSPFPLGDDPSRWRPNGSTPTVRR